MDVSSQAPSAVVCGAGGFIGGHLVKGLLARGLRVIRAVDIKPVKQWHQATSGVENLSLDLKQPKNCLEATRGADHVYQLAADMGGMGFIQKNKTLCMLNVLINTNMLLAARESGISRFFFASSACVYNAARQNSPNALPLREADAYPAMPEDGYGWEKLFSERMCGHFADEFGLSCRVARYHNVYGPHGTWTGGREKAPAAICRKVIAAQRSGTHRISIWGDGRQTRSFMFVDDCIEGTIRIMNSDIGEPINLGSSELVTVNQLVDLAEEIGGTRLERCYEPGAPIGVSGRNSDNSMILERLGWEPSMALRQGLEITYRWIEQQMAPSKQPRLPAYSVLPEPLGGPIVFGQTDSPDLAI